MNVQSFTTTFEIESAIRWDIYKSNLAEVLFDRAAADPFCPRQISDSAYTGEVVVEGKEFVVTIAEGQEV